jgi:hypothetical protein
MNAKARLSPFPHYNDAKSAFPSGTPHPVTASKPGVAEYPVPGFGCEAFCPLVMSRQADLPRGSPLEPFW